METELMSPKYIAHKFVLLKSNPHCPLKEAFPHLNELDCVCVSVRPDFHSGQWRICADVGEMLGREASIQNAECLQSPPRPSGPPAVLLTAHIWTAGLSYWKFISMLWNFLWQDVKTKTSIFQSSVETSTSTAFYFCLSALTNIDLDWPWSPVSLMFFSLRYDTGDPLLNTVGLLKNVSL